MKKITEEMLGLSGFRFVHFGCWNADTNAGSRLCFDKFNPLRNIQHLAPWDICFKIHSKINEIVFDKTNNLNITESYEKLK